MSTGMSLDKLNLIVCTVHPTRAQEEFSHAYVQAICSQLNMAYERKSVDAGGIDATIEAHGRVEPSWLHDSPKIDIQLKSTSAHQFEDSELAYPLKIGNYNWLVGDRFVYPRYLVVLLVPSSQEEWILLDESGILLTKHAYWLSLADESPSSNTSSKTVYIPEENQFDTRFLERAITEAAGWRSVQ